MLHFLEWLHLKFIYFWIDLILDIYCLIKYRKTYVKVFKNLPWIKEEE
jgi:hypothetical protein